MLVIDAMTFDGFVNSVNRHGMARTRATPIQRASFEEALDVLIEACTFGSRVEVKGDTECVVMGTPSSIGSGHCTIIQETVANNSNKSYSLPFVGRKQPTQPTHVIVEHRKQPVQPTHTIVKQASAEQWRASEYFEPKRVLLDNIKQGQSLQLAILAEISESEPKIFSISILPEKHDDAAEQLMHMSFRDNSLLIFNNKKNDTWGEEIRINNLHVNLKQNFKIQIVVSKFHFLIKINTLSKKSLNIEHPYIPPVEIYF